MSHKSRQRPLGRYFALPPRWRWLFWPTLTLGSGGMALTLWLEEGALTLGLCAPLAALPGMAGLLYWFNRLLFKAAQPERKDMTVSAPTPMTANSSTPGAAPTWHTLPLEDVFAELHAEPNGLSGSEAARRLAEHGPNELQAAHRISPWALLAEQFKNVLIVILLLATAMSAFLGHGIEAAAIAVIVLFAVLLGFIQEYRAERAIEALRQMAAPTATVLRDGQEVEVPARDLAPGDVVPRAKVELVCTAVQPAGADSSIVVR